MFNSRLFWPDGSEAGEAAYAVRVAPGEEVLTAAGRLRVLDGVPVNDEDSPYVGLLKVESA